MLRLGVRYDNLPGQGTEAKARELIALLSRRDRIKELIEAGKKSREDIVWPDTVSGGKTSPKPPVSASDSRQAQGAAKKHNLSESLPPQARYLLAAIGVLIVIVVLVVVVMKIIKSKDNLQTGTPNTLIIQGGRTDILEIPEGKPIYIQMGEETLSMVVKPVERLPGFDQYRRDADITFATERNNEPHNLRSGDCVYLHPFTINIIYVEPFVPHSVQLFVTKVAAGFDASSCRIAPTATPAANQ